VKNQSKKNVQTRNFGKAEQYNNVPSPYCPITAVTPPAIMGDGNEQWGEAVDSKWIDIQKRVSLLLSS
jgi:hypothetical protein